MPKHQVALAYELFVCDECEGYGRLGKLDKDAKIRINLHLQIVIYNGTVPKKFVRIVLLRA